jgi:hypothetical protein
VGKGVVTSTTVEPVPPLSGPASSIMSILSAIWVKNGVKSTLDPCSKLIRVKSRLDPPDHLKRNNQESIVEWMDAQDRLLSNLSYTTIGTKKVKVIYSRKAGAALMKQVKRQIKGDMLLLMLIHHKKGLIIKNPPPIFVPYGKQELVKIKKLYYFCRVSSEARGRLNLLCKQRLKLGGI